MGRDSSGGEGYVWNVCSTWWFNSEAITMRSTIIWAMAGAAAAFVVFYSLLSVLGFAEKVG